MKRLTPTFAFSILLILLFIIWGLIPEKVMPNLSLNAITTIIQNIFLTKFGWFYLLSASTVVIFTLFLAFSRYGNVRLGKDEDRPEFSTTSWFAMLFSAGMGIELVFWGGAEPLNHYYNPPLIEGQTDESSRLAIPYSFFHWGIHSWAPFVGMFIARISRGRTIESLSLGY